LDLHALMFSDFVDLAGYSKRLVANYLFMIRQKMDDSCEEDRELYIKAIEAVFPDVIPTIEPL